MFPEIKLFFAYATLCNTSPVLQNLQRDKTESYKLKNANIIEIKY